MNETALSPLLQLTAQIVAAHVAHNPVKAEDLPKLIEGVYEALAGSRQTTLTEPKQEPVVPIKRSVFSDHIVCLEDGKRFKMLKRHLMRTYGLTPEQYRKKWDLPPTYPMVAPDYAARRSDLAKAIGLGRRPSTSVPPKASAKPLATRKRYGRKNAPTS